MWFDLPPITAGDVAVDLIKTLVPAAFPDHPGYGRWACSGCRVTATNATSDDAEEHAGQCDAISPPIQES